MDSKTLDKKTSDRLNQQGYSISTAKYNFSTIQQRIFMLCIHDLKNKDYDISDVELNTNIHLKVHDIGSNYENLKVQLDKLFNIILEYDAEIDGEPAKRFLPLIKSFKINDNDLKIEIGNVVLSDLKNLGKSWTVYNLDTALKFTGKYTARFYILANQFKKQGHFRYTIFQLREMLGLKDSEYKETKVFKARVLLKAFKELEESEKSEIYLSIRAPFKDGRKIAGFVFDVIKKEADTAQGTLDLPAPVFPTDRNAVLNIVWNYMEKDKNCTDDDFNYGILDAFDKKRGCTWNESPFTEKDFNNFKKYYNACIKNR